MVREGIGTAFGLLGDGKGQSSDRQHSFANGARIIGKQIIVYGSVPGSVPA